MLTSLLYQNNPDGRPKTAVNAGELLADLGLTPVIDAMAEGDPVRADAARKLLFEADAVSVKDALLRQNVLRDAISNEKAFFSLYGLLKDGLERHDEEYRKGQPGYARFTPVVERIRSAATLMDMLFALVESVKQALAKNEGRFHSQALKGYALAFSERYSDAFIKESRSVQKMLAGISDGSAVTVGARLGGGMKGASYVLRSVDPVKRLERRPKAARNAIELDSVNHQQRAVELRDSALSKVFQIAAMANSRVLNDLRALLFALAFYVGGARLYRVLQNTGSPVVFPIIEAESEALSFDGLVDIGLALKNGEKPVPNTLNLSGARLVIVTGANQGGKSTFLRSLGCAQVMARCGLFVAAERFCAGACPNVFTHFCRPEDAGMDSGKLDEELARMNAIVDRLLPGSLLMMNESFASTAEREGAAIARELTETFIKLGVRTVYVTHLYEYARSMGERALPDVVLLRAGRADDGSRSFEVTPGLALPTSHGLDLFNSIIG